jgi:hypothetical protein
MTPVQSVNDVRTAGWAGRHSGGTLVKVLAIVAALVVVVVAGLVLFVSAVLRGRGSGHDARPGADAFQNANRQIAANHGVSAFGNTPDANRLATEYSKMLKRITEEAFTGGKRGAISLTDGNVLTYCHLTPTSCVFLVHVPELRQYKNDVRDMLAAFAWAAGQQVLEQSGTKGPLTVGVGLRGAMLYGPVMIGQLGSEVPSTNVSGKEELLFPMFVSSPADTATSQPTTSESSF